MKLTFIDNSGTAFTTAQVDDDINPKRLAEDLLTGADPLYIKVCHGVRYPKDFLLAAEQCWEIEVEGVRQKTGEPTFARFTRSVKL